MNSVFQRCAAAVLGFGFVAVALSLGVGSALECLLSSAAFYGAASLLQRKRLDRFTIEFMGAAKRRTRRERRSDSPRRSAYDYA